MDSCLPKQSHPVKVNPRNIEGDAGISIKEKVKQRKKFFQEKWSNGICISKRKMIETCLLINISGFTKGISHKNDSNEKRTTSSNLQTSIEKSSNSSMMPIGAQVGP